MSARRSSSSSRLLQKSELEVDIVNDPDIVLYFYEIMQSAAKHAVDRNEIDDFNQYDVLYDVLELGKKGQFRVVKNNNNSKFRTLDYFVEYKPADIYVYGGCALTLYDVALRGPKKERGLNALEMRVRKKTTDIDLVWFPRVPEVLVGLGHMVTSTSPAIRMMVSRLQKYLTKNQSRYQRELKNLLQQKLVDRHTIHSVKDFTVKHTHIIKAGVHSIEISCDVNGMTLKLCEISIHDSGSSQQYNENHERIPFLQHMTEDPVYCSPKELIDVSIHEHTVRVPNIVLYCKQQLFIVGNKLRSDDFRTPNQIALDYKKALVSFYRVAFVLYLLESLRQNQRNVSERIHVDNIGHTVDTIHEMINHMKRVFHKEIQSLCSMEMNDEVRMLLCGPLKQIKKSLSHSMSSHNRETKKRQIHDTLKRSIINLNSSIYTLMQTITRNTPMNTSDELLKLQRDVWEMMREVDEKNNTSAKSHHNFDKKVEKLNSEIKKLYDKYYEVVDKLDIQSLRIVSASSAQLAALPPLHPSRSHLSASRQSHTRKKSPNRSPK